MHMVPRANTVAIATAGASTATVVVDEAASPSQQHAARELARFLTEVTGAGVPVVHHASPASPRLLVGPAAARLADAMFTTDGLGAEGFVIRTVGRDLILAGGEPRGSLYAVYSFLEDHLGCRWWTATASTVPRIRDLTVRDLDMRFVPVLEMRDPFWFGAFDGDWAVRNKSNAHNARLDAQRGGHWHLEHPDWCHTFYRLVPPDDCFAEHPEWYSLVNGCRTHTVTARVRGAEYEMPAQLCLTNEEMRRYLVESLRRKLREDPQVTYTSVSQMDEFPGFDGRCECEECRAVETEEGSPAGLIIRFVNKVAQDLEEEFPYVAVGTLAYHYTREPPRKVRPRDNVIVTLCAFECDCGVPLTHDRNAHLRDHIVAWSQICGRLWVWDYVTNHANYTVPLPNLRTLAPNTRFLIAHNVTGIFSQGAGPTPGAEMAELKAWVTAKLMWDPTGDGPTLVDQFVDGYYGPAAGHVRAYLNLIHDALTAADEAYVWQTARVEELRFLRFGILMEGWRHLKAAAEAVGDDPEMHLRIEIAQLPVLRVFLLRWDEFRTVATADGTPWPLADEILEVLETLKDVARRAGITHWAEGATDFDGMLPERESR